MFLRAFPRGRAEEISDGRVSSSQSRLRRETRPPRFRREAEAATIVLGTRQKREVSARGSSSRATVTSQGKDLIQLESLILAQNERWRQA